MITVLSVDDESHLLDVARIFLERSGEFKVGITTSAQEALELLTARPFDAIIPDYQMPEMDGIGIVTDEKERIFEQGFGRNTGFGMFLVREIQSLAGITITGTGEPKKRRTVRDGRPLRGIPHHPKNNAAGILTCIPEIP